LGVLSEQNATDTLDLATEITRVTYVNGMRKQSASNVSSNATLA